MVEEQTGETYLWVKIGFIAVSLILAILSAYIPFKIGTFKNSRAILGVANCFAGGIFMSIAFIHLLPEVSENYKDWVNEGKPEEEEVIPLPFILLFSGYTLILFIDKVMFDSHGYFHEHEHGEGHDHGEGHKHGHSHVSEGSDEPAVSKSFVEVAKKMQLGEKVN